MSIQGRDPGMRNAQFFLAGTGCLVHTYYFLIQYSLDDRLKYTDDEIYDGMFYTFEIISANPEENTICFVSARVWDYHPDQVLIDYLQPISDLESES